MHRNRVVALAPRITFGALLLVTLLTAPTAGQPCIGDCGGDGEVSVDEVTTGVLLALGDPAAAACDAFDLDGDQRVDVADVITAITNVLQGCPVDPFIALARERDENLAKWRAAGIDDYEIDYQRGCFCPPPSDVRIVVRDGIIVAVYDRDTGEEIDNDFSGAFAFNSVDGLFAVIGEAIAQPVAELSVEYDAELGYPVSTSIDFIAGAVDDEITIRISALRQLPTP